LVAQRVDKEGGGVLTMWNNMIFKCIRTKEDKGFVLIVGEYKCGGVDQYVSMTFMNV